MNRYFKLTKTSRSTLKLNSSHILRRLVESKVTRFDEKQQQVFGLLQIRTEQNRILKLMDGIHFSENCSTY